MLRGVAKVLHALLELCERLILERLRLPLPLGLEEDGKGIRASKHTAPISGYSLSIEVLRTQQKPR